MIRHPDMTPMSYPNKKPPNATLNEEGMSGMAGWEDGETYKPQKMIAFVCNMGVWGNG